MKKHLNITITNSKPLPKEVASNNERYKLTHFLNLLIDESKYVATVT